MTETPTEMMSVTQPTPAPFVCRRARFSGSLSNSRETSSECCRVTSEQQITGQPRARKDEVTNPTLAAGNGSSLKPEGRSASFVAVDTGDLRNPKCRVVWRESGFPFGSPFFGGERAHVSASGITRAQLIRDPGSLGARKAAAGTEALARVFLVLPLRQDPGQRWCPQEASGADAAPS